MRWLITEEHNLSLTHTHTWRPQNSYQIQNMHREEDVQLRLCVITPLVREQQHKGGQTEEERRSFTSPRRKEGGFKRWVMSFLSSYALCEHARKGGWGVHAQQGGQSPEKCFRLINPFKWTVDGIAWMKELNPGGEEDKRGQCTKKKKHKEEQQKNGDFLTCRPF